MRELCTNLGNYVKQGWRNLWANDYAEGTKTIAHKTISHGSGLFYGIANGCLYFTGFLAGPRMIGLMDHDISITNSPWEGVVFVIVSGSSVALLAYNWYRYQPRIENTTRGFKCERPKNCCYKTGAAYVSIFKAGGAFFTLSYQLNKIMSFPGALVCSGILNVGHGFSQYALYSQKEKVEVDDPDLEAEQQPLLRAAGEGNATESESESLAPPIN